MLKYFLTLYIYSSLLCNAQTIEFLKTHHSEKKTNTWIDIDYLGNLYFLKDAYTLCKKNTLQKKNTCFQSLNYKEIKGVDIYNSFTILLNYEYSPFVSILDNEMNLKQEIEQEEFEENPIIRLENSREIYFFDTKNQTLRTINFNEKPQISRELFYPNEIFEEIIEFKILKKYFVFQSASKYWLYDKQGNFMHCKNTKDFLYFGFYANYFIQIESNNQLKLVNLDTFLEDFSFDIKHPIENAIFKGPYIYLKEKSNLYQYKITL